MLLSSQSEEELNRAGNAPNPVAVREQLKRLLAHSLFTNSKRYPVLLAYTVEQTLLGNAGELKERTIGIEAFGREPSYDVNLDPVARMTAAEVRKRLIQYYYNPDHAGEPVIELPVGSYVPMFRDPVILKVGLLPEAVNSENSEIASPDSVDSEIVPVKNSYPRTLFAACLLVALLAGFGAGRIRLPKRPTNMERFWEPIVA